MRITSLLNLRSTTALCTLALWPLSAFGSVIVDQNFETGTLGDLGWTITGSTITLEASAQSSAGDPGDNVGIQLKDDTSTPGQPYVALNFSAPTDLQTTVQFDFQFPGANANNAMIQLRNGSSIAVQLYLAALPDNEIRVHNGTTHIDLDPEVFLSSDSWYRFTLNLAPLDSATDSFGLRIQSLDDSSLDAYYAGLPFRNNVASIDSLRFLFNEVSAPGTVYTIDNLLITHAVPEPTTASMVVLGIAALTALRRRK